MSIDDKSLEDMLEDMNLEDMNKEERQQCVDKYNRWRREMVERVPFTTTTRLPNEAELRRQLKELEEKAQHRLQKWIDKGGLPSDFD